MARAPEPLDSNFKSLEDLTRPLADHTQLVHDALAGGLTFGENFLCEIKSLPRIDVPASWTTGGFPMLIASKIKNAIGVLPLRATPRVAGTLVPLWGVDWEPVENGIRLKALPGLTVAASYSVTLLIVGG